MRGTGSHIHAHVSDRAPATVTMPLDATANALGALSATVRLINRSARFGLRTLRTLLACEARRQSLYRGVWQQNASDLRPPCDEELGLGVCPSALGNSASWMQPSPPPASAAQSMQHVLRPVPQRHHTFSAQSLHPPAGRAPPTLHSAHLSASSASAFTELPRAAAQRQPQRSPASASAANEPPPPPSSSAPPSADQLASVHALLDHLNAHDTPPPTSITAGVAAAHSTSRPHASTHRAIAAAAYAATHPQTPCSDLPAQFAASARSLSTWRVKLHPTLSLATAARHCTQLHAAGQLRALSDEERGEGVAASAFCTSASQPLYPAATARRVLVLFSGPYERADGLGQHLSESGFEVTLADNDPVHGDASHDILDDAFFQHQLHLVNWGYYFAVFAAPPCSTYSVSRHFRAKRNRRGDRGPPPLRSRRSPQGLDPPPHGHARELEQANLITDRLCALLEAAAAASAEFIVENPTDRGDPCSLHTFLFADHAPLWLHPSIVELRRSTGAKLCTFAQCEFGAPYQKYTSLLYTPALSPYLDAWSHKRCSHANHAELAGGTRGQDGA